MRTRSRGFTLLEVLVATTIMALAVSTALSALSTSVRNASRLSESDKLSVMAKRTMDDLLASPPLPYGRVLQGVYDPRETGLESGWRARVEPFEKVPGAPDEAGLERIVLELWWTHGNERRTLSSEGYRQKPRTS